MQSRLAQYTVARPGLHESILDTIGKTPIVRLRHLSPAGVNVYVKLESENPGGSVKDRLAYGVIEWAEKHGHLKPGQVRERYPKRGFQNQFQSHQTTTSLLPSTDHRRGFFR